MKKLAILSAALLLCLTTGCSSTELDNSSTTVPESVAVDSSTSATVSSVEKETKTTSVQLSVKTADDYYDALSKIINIEGNLGLAAEYVGAKETRGFTYNEIPYDIYLYEDEEILADASDGEYSYVIEGFGEPIDCTSKTTVNGNFVLFYDSGNDSENKTVTEAFMSVK